MIHWLLKQLPPELAHTIAKAGMKRGLSTSGICIPEGQDLKLFGTPIKNRLGLAAGFDKNAELLDTFSEYGFGWLEVGSVTWRGGPGNKKPRLFRVEGWDILNRMGLNGQPANEVYNKLHTSPVGNFAVNITKTNDKSIIGDKAIIDIVNTFSLMKHVGIYCCINISCPNTEDGKKTFEEPEALKELISAIHQNGVVRPITIKLSPSLSDDAIKLDKVINIIEEFNINGVITSNTLSQEHTKYGRGGRSGKGVFPKSLKLTQMVRQRTTRTIIGLGGIFTGAEMYLYKLAGADFFQAYNGFVRGPYAGPLFAHKVNADYRELIDALHFAN